MSKVLRFGVISEGARGLTFEGFEIDTEKESATDSVLMLKAVIARLQEELQKQLEPTGDGPYAFRNDAH